MDNSIQDVEEQIRKVEREILAVTEELARASDKEKEHLRKKEEQLRKEKEQLRKEKEQLRKEKEQLREEKLIALRAGSSTSMPDAGRQRDRQGTGASTPEAEARARVIARYAATDATGRCMFTPFLERILVTYYHGSHSALKVGQDIKVRVNDGTRDKQRLVKARVLGVHPSMHVLFCSTAEPINAPDLDISVRAAEPYIMLGCSNLSQQGTPFSTSHGSISTTTPDINGFIRGDTASLPGDSGGGCFSAETGKLIAMNVAADLNNGNRAVLVTVATLMTLLREHHIEEVQNLMPDIIRTEGHFVTGDE